MNAKPNASYNEILAGLRKDAGGIFSQALAGASIASAFDRRFAIENGELLRRSPQGLERFLAQPLSGFEKLYLISLGKAALPMLEALLARLPQGLPVSGICCAPVLPDRPHPGIAYYAGGHPSPNLDSFRSAHHALALLARAGERSLVIFLISGGGSSLFEAPLDPGIGFDETVAFHRALVGSGATIAEINAVRKHFSAVKGGRLAAAAGSASMLSLFVCDVPLIHLDALASGPTLPDRSTVTQCREILEHYDLISQFPAAVRSFFSDPNLPETPAAPHSYFDVLLSNDDLIDAARAHAEQAGWKVFVDNSCDDWDYREAADYLLDRLRQLKHGEDRICLLSGGEVTVRLEGTPGVGGRNQQFALACALEMDEEMANSDTAMAVLSAGSDGIDGMSPAAGAIVDPTTVARARAHGLDASAALAAFDAYSLFHALGDSIRTDPTNNNLRDLRILLSA